LAQSKALTNDSPASSQAGFRAHLLGVHLHDLVALAQRRGSSGVFVVLSGDCSGSLHFEHGELVHAETQELAGDFAALEILSWGQGEFIASQRAPEQLRTVSMSLEGLLERLNGALEPPLTTATGIRRRPGATTQLGAAAAPLSGTGTLAAAATPGVAAVPPSPRTAVGEAGVSTNVLVSARGEIVDAQGPNAEALAGRVSYLARLAELVGQAMGSGETRAFRVREARGELCARRYGDGSLSGASTALDAGEAGLPSSSRRR
jgi:hypothetical protein